MYEYTLRAIIKHGLSRVATGGLGAGSAVCVRVLCTMCYYSSAHDVTLL